MDLNGNKQFFIPRQRLGVVEGMAMSLLTETSKRKIGTNLRTLSRVLRDLKLIQGEVRMIGLGANYLGEQGLIVLTGEATPIQPQERVEAKIPGEG